jgi:hypothetical protein
MQKLSDESIMQLKELHKHLKAGKDIHTARKLSRKYMEDQGYRMSKDRTKWMSAKAKQARLALTPGRK